MTKLSLTALMVWALCFSGANCGAAKVQGPQTQGPNAPKAEQPVSPTVKLTPEHASASLPVAADIFQSDPEVLEVSITKVENTAGTPISIFVYLANGKAKKADAEKILVGNFSLYPADSPGKFMLNPRLALRTMLAKTPKPNDPRLVFELRQIDATKPWTPVEVTVEQPKWRAAEKN
jgi:hypothetical protein